MKTKLICGLIAFAVILGCGGAGAPYVPDGNNTTGGNFSVGGGGTQTINPGQSANSLCGCCSVSSLTSQAARLRQSP